MRTTSAVRAITVNKELTPALIGTFRGFHGHLINAQREQRKKILENGTLYVTKLIAGFINVGLTSQT